MNDDYDINQIGIEEKETGEVCIIDGIRCEIIKWRPRATKGRYFTAYRFTVPGWSKCVITGLRDTRRVIRGRLDPMTRILLGIDS